MEHWDIERIARDAMQSAGLVGWRIEWDNARRRAGITRFNDRVISFSRPLMALFDPAEVHEVIAHEIAHALVGPSHNHDAVWAAAARALGASGRAQLPSSVPKPPAPWVGACPNGHEFERFRRPNAQASCSRCSARYDARFMITWRRAA